MCKGAFYFLFRREAKFFVAFCFFIVFESEEEKKILKKTPW